MISSSGNISWFSGPYVQVIINGKLTQAFLDTGAFSTIIADDFLHEMFADQPPQLEPYAGNCLDASGNTMNILGKAKTRIVTPNGKFSTEILVYKRCPKMEHQLLVGMDILSNSVLDLNDKRLYFTGKNNKHESINEQSYQLKIEFPDSNISGTPRSILKETHRVWV